MTLPKNPFVRYLAYSQAVFFAAVLLCIAIAPASLAANTGLSYFGVREKTVLIYGIGLILSAYFILKALRFAPKVPGMWPVTRGLRLLPPLMAGVAITPYSIDNWFDWIHHALGITLFSLQLLIAIWLVARSFRDWLNWLLLAAQFAGGIISLIYLAPSHGLLIQGQLIFQAAFGILLFRNLLRLKHYERG
ncbi:MAG: hypothetical protein ABSD10_00805 [Candidatus Saccharimonadales bacterium]|jgi:hypothetical protein